MLLFPSGVSDSLVVSFQNILGLKGIPHDFFLEVYYTFHRIPEARPGDVVLGLLCISLLLMLLFMKSSLPSENDPLQPKCSRVARNLVWTIATSQYLPSLRANRSECPQCPERVSFRLLQSGTPWWWWRRRWWPSPGTPLVTRSSRSPAPLPQGCHRSGPLPPRPSQPTAPWSPSGRL